MIQQIRKWADPILKLKCQSISFLESLSVAEDLIDTLAETPNGVGMAAPQIGIDARVIVIWSPRTQKPIIMIDPEPLSAGSGTQMTNEGCLSFPGTYVNIRRPKFIKLTYVNVKGVRVKTKERGYDAAVIMHEMDHLDGICLVGDYWKAEEDAILRPV